MSDENFTVSQQGPARIVAQACGKFSAAEVEKLSRALLAHLAGGTNGAAGTSPPGAMNVVVDLREVTDVALDRDTVLALARMQNSLAPRARRTVYFADRPALRSLARRAAHEAGDDNAGIAATAQQVEDWISLHDGRRKHQGLRMRTQFECVEKTLEYESWARTHRSSGQRTPGGGR